MYLVCLHCVLFTMSVLLFRFNEGVTDIKAQSIQMVGTPKEVFVEHKLSHVPTMYVTVWHCYQLIQDVSQHSCHYSGGTCYHFPFLLLLLFPCLHLSPHFLPSFTMLPISPCILLFLPSTATLRWWLIAVCAGKRSYSCTSNKPHMEPAVSTAPKESSITATSTSLL